LAAPCPAHCLPARAILASPGPHARSLLARLCGLLKVRLRHGARGSGGRKMACLLRRCTWPAGGTGQVPRSRERSPPSFEEACAAPRSLVASTRRRGRMQTGRRLGLAVAGMVACLALAVPALAQQQQPGRNTTSGTAPGGVETSSTTSGGAVSAPSPLPIPTVSLSTGTSPGARPGAATGTATGAAGAEASAAPTPSIGGAPPPRTASTGGLAAPTPAALPTSGTSAGTAPSTGGAAGTTSTGASVSGTPSGAAATGGASAAATPAGGGVATARPTAVSTVTLAAGATTAMGGTRLPTVGTSATPGASATAGTTGRAGVAGTRTGTLVAGRAGGLDPLTTAGALVTLGIISLGAGYLLRRRAA